MKKREHNTAGAAWAGWLGDSPTPATDDLTSAIDRLYATTPSAARARTALGDALRRPDARDTKSREPLVYGELRGSPLGAVFVAFSRQGMVALEFGVSERTFVDHLQRQTGLQAHPGVSQARPALRQIREYLQGTRRRFAVPLDLSRLTDFQRRVLKATMAVPAGRVATYHEIAKQIGRPRAARAVGRALATNPIPLVIPCHRVIASDGSLTGYGGKGGIATKARLLKMEGALAL